MGGLRRSGDGGPARRRWRWRRIVVVVILLLLLPAIYSYAHWMLRPSSMPFGVRSVEWVRADVPFGNQLVDEIEHIYYSWNAPKKGGPQLKSLPHDRARPRRRRAEGGCLAAADQAGLRAPATRRRDLEADRPAGRGWPAGAGDDLPPRARLSEHRRLRGLVRPHAHRARLLSGPLRAAERRRTRADDGPERPALAAACDLQQRLHLHGRQQRLDRQRPRERAARDRATPRSSAIATAASRSRSGAAARTRGRTSPGPARACRRSSGTDASTPP